MSVYIYIHIHVIYGQEECVMLEKKKKERKVGSKIMRIICICIHLFTWPYAKRDSFWVPAEISLAKSKHRTVKGEVYRVCEVGSSSIHDSILIAKPTLIKPWRCRCRKHSHKRVSLWRAVAFGSTLQATRDASFGFPFRRRPTFTSIAFTGTFSLSLGSIRLVYSIWEV